MKSMTGFGVARGAASVKGDTGGVDIEISVRSVNGRFLETRFHLPREYFAIESELKSLVSQHIKRGTVDIFVTRRAKAKSRRQKVVVNNELANEYFKASQSLSKKLKLTSPIHLESILRMPGVLIVEDDLEVNNVESAALLSVLKKALKKQTDERIREGAALKRELLLIVGDLIKIVDSIELHREEANKLLEQKLQARFEQKNKTIAVEPQRFAQELMIYLEKADINEEIVRLREHLQTYRGLLSKGGAEGKQLDFYTQELLREINTIGSKSQVAMITALVVQAKTFVERLREQVQNLE